MLKHRNTFHGFHVCFWTIWTCIWMWPKQGNLITQLFFRLVGGCRIWRKLQMAWVEVWRMQRYRCSCLKNWNKCCAFDGKKGDQAKQVAQIHQSKLPWLLEMCLPGFFWGFEGHKGRVPRHLYTVLWFLWDSMAQRFDWLSGWIKSAELVVESLNGNFSVMGNLPKKWEFHGQNVCFHGEPQENKFLSSKSLMFPWQGSTLSDLPSCFQLPVVRKQICKLDLTELRHGDVQVQRCQSDASWFKSFVRSLLNLL